MAEKEYIEREKLNDMLEDFCVNESFYDALQTIPAADVAPVRHGHWDTISDSDMNKTVMCSVCNKIFYFTKKGQLNIDKMPHCPNCGAKMDGDTNGS